MRKARRPTATTRVLRLAAPHWRPMAVGFVALALGAAVNLYFPEFIRYLLSEDNGGRLAGAPWRLFGVLTGLFLLQGVAIYLRALTFGQVGQRVVADLRDALYTSILRQPMATFDTARVGDLVSRLSADAASIQNAVSVTLGVLVRYTLQVIFGVVLMAYISPRLTLLILIALAIVLVSSFVLARRLRFLSRAQQEALGAATVVAEETFHGVRLVKAFGRIRREVERFAEANNITLQRGLARTRLGSFFQSFGSVLLNIALAYVLVCGLQMVYQGTLSLGELSAFLLYGLIVGVSFAFLAGAYTEFAQGIGAGERVFEYLDAASSAVVVQPTRSLPEPFRGSVHFRNVSFAYPSRPEPAALQDLSFTLEPGKTLAVVGPSGAGKSTIINLLLGFYPPLLGDIQIDGVPLQEVPLESYLQHVAYVPQDTLIFHLSIADNLRFGKERATLEELESVCAKVNLLETIRALPQRWDTLVGDRGVQLSGGQRQRLAIARALLRDPKLLLLDEATSALDSENEALIQKAIATLMEGRTTIVIAHRLATVKNADQLLVLDKGRVVQQGTHASLSTAPGLYRLMVERQELATS